MSLCCLTDPNIDLVADTSTAINLNASGYAREILSAIPNALLVTDVVLGELSEDFTQWTPGCRTFLCTCRCRFGADR